MTTITRGYIGRQDSSYVVRFTKPGIDYYAAGPTDFLFREDGAQARALVEGTLLAAPTGATSITLPKNFSGTPLIFVAMLQGTDHVLMPDDDTYQVWFYRGGNTFAIDNKSGGPADFHYVVFDNEIS